MQTRQPDTEQIDVQQSTGHPGQSGRNRWLASIGALLVVLVVIAGSVVVFALAGQGRQGSSNTPTIPTGQWKAVEHSYLFLSISPAASNPSVLYACATTSSVISEQG